MDKYFILYKNEAISRDMVFQTDMVCADLAEVKKSFERHYNAVMVAVRKGRKYNDQEIKKKREAIRNPKKGKFQAGDSVIVEIGSKTKTEWVDAVVTAVTSIGINVKTFWGQDYQHCHPKCVKRR